MKISAIKTAKIRPGDYTLTAFLDAFVAEVPQKSVVAIASKVVSICEGAVVAMQDANKEQLIARETSQYLPAAENPYNVALSITHNMLVVAGGIDESNGDGYFVLWPKDRQASANMIRAYLCKKFNIQHLGVVITDSVTRPFQWGTTGLGIAYSGFAPLKDYIGENDVFGHKLQFQKNNIMNGLAASAVLVMGEGDEQKPLAVIEDVPFVDFQPRDPSLRELEDLAISPDDDVYSPLFAKAPWHKGMQR